MRTIVVLIAGLLLGVPAGAAGQGPDLQTEEQKTLYALGLMLSQNLRNYALTPAEFELVQAGLADGTLRRPRKVELQPYQNKVRQFQVERTKQRTEEGKKAGEAYLAKAVTEPGATKTASGLIITTVKAGTGPSPALADRVKVHYTGRLVDGTTFDSSERRGEPVLFPLNGVIKCWTEALQLMKVGGKSKLVCPPELAYGERGAPPRILPGATLLFDVELVEIVK
jgi:FKBP-type peptidyl-prolyl cis-trans isomerase FkpA/FKBP-type peptidyl-prolyl cis-trans isomerase FklB